MSIHKLFPTNDNLIQNLKELLNEAESGEIKGLLLVSLDYSGNSTRLKYLSKNVSIFELLGAFEMCKHDLIDWTNNDD